MITNYLLLIASICPHINIENHTPIWNNHDQYVLEKMIPFCSQAYQYKTCLVKFVKTEENKYSALCGLPGPTK